MIEPHGFAEWMDGCRGSWIRTAVTALGLSEQRSDVNLLDGLKPGAGGAASDEDRIVIAVIGKSDAAGDFLLVKRVCGDPGRVRVL